MKTSMNGETQTKITMPGKTAKLQVSGEATFDFATWVISPPVSCILDMQRKITVIV